MVHPEQYPYVAEAIPLAPEFRQRALERLDAFVALSRGEGVRTRFSVAEGAPVSAILEAAEADRSSLLCLGTHGREGVERLILGSVAEKVLRKSRCPVLTVSEPGEILAVARERKVDLIAIGVRGRNPLDIMLFGSTTQHVVRHAECPVLTISEGS